MDRLPGLLICAYQPDQSLIPLLQTFLKDPYPSILLVDDGSGDPYRQIFEKIALLERVEILHLPKNQGKGNALKEGFRHMMSRGWSSSHVLCADSDGQHLPVDVKKVAVACSSDGPGQNTIFLGARAFDQLTPFRNLFGNRITKILVNFLFKTSLSDTQTGLRGIPLPYLKMFIDIPSSRFDYEMRQLLLAVMKKLPIKEISIQAIYPRQGRSHFRVIRDSIHVYRALFGLAFLNRRGAHGEPS